MINAIRSPSGIAPFITSLPPNQSTETVVRFISRVITGCMQIITSIALIPACFKSPFDFLNFFISKSRRTKDFTTRTLVMFSCMFELRPSTLSCIIPKRGKPMRIIINKTANSTGIATARTTASDGRKAIAINKAPISMPGARKNIRRSIFTKFCICVTSFVSLVTSEPVENLSILANEKLCIFENTSRRTSVAKLTEAFAPKKAPPIPPAIINTAVRIISAQVPATYCQFPLFTPSFIIWDRNFGISTSPTTSTTIQNGPKIKNSLYGFTYFIHLFIVLYLFLLSGQIIAYSFKIA